MVLTPLTKHEALRKSQDPVEGLDCFNRVYSVSYSTLATTTTQTPDLRFVTFAKNEYFFLTGITAIYFGTGLTVADSPKVAFWDLKTNKALSSSWKNNSQLSTDPYYKVEGNFTPGLESKPLTYIHEFNHFFAPESQLKVGALSAGLNAVDLEIGFHGFAVRIGKV